jgi:ubiquitin-conjugating enzyme E2 J2
MTSDEMTTGSVHATDAERRWAAARTRWWNSTGGGTHTRLASGLNPSTRGIGAVKAGDGGVKFSAEWPGLHRENWAWIKENGIDDVTGELIPEAGVPENKCSAEVAALRRGPSGSGVVGAVVGGGQAAREAGQGWMRRHKLLIGVMLVVGYVLLARLLGDGGGEAAVN